MSILRAPKRVVDKDIAIESLMRWAEQITTVLNTLVDNIPSDSTASDVAGIVSDFNDLLAVLRGLSAR